MRKFLPVLILLFALNLVVLLQLVCSVIVDQATFFMITPNGSLTNSFDSTNSINSTGNEIDASICFSRCLASYNSTCLAVTTLADSATGLFSCKYLSRAPNSSEYTNVSSSVMKIYERYQPAAPTTTTTTTTTTTPTTTTTTATTTTTTATTTTPTTTTTTATTTTTTATTTTPTTTTTTTTATTTTTVTSTTTTTTAKTTTTTKLTTTTTTTASPDVILTGSRSSGNITLNWIVNSRFTDPLRYELYYSTDSWATQTKLAMSVQAYQYFYDLFPMNPGTGSTFDDCINDCAADIANPCELFIYDPAYCYFGPLIVDPLYQSDCAANACECYTLSYTTTYKTVAVQPGVYSFKIRVYDKTQAVWTQYSASITV